MYKLGGFKIKNLCSHQTTTERVTKKPTEYEKGICKKKNSYKSIKNRQPDREK